MRDRIITGVLLALVIVFCVLNDMVLFPTLLLLMFMILEIVLRKPFSFLTILALLQAFGILVANLLTPYELLFVAAVVVTNDSMAYFGGKYLNFGVLKAKIFPITSPNKTYGGTFYGVLFSNVVGLTLNSYLDLYDPFVAVLLSLIFAYCGILGDFLESKFKRWYGVKDSGDGLFTKDLLKGHGGFYDRFDAITLALWGWFYVEMIGGL